MESKGKLFNLCSNQKIFNMVWSEPRTAKKGRGLEHGVKSDLTLFGCIQIQHRSLGPILPELRDRIYCINFAHATLASKYLLE